MNNNGSLPDGASEPPPDEEHRFYEDSSLVIDTSDSLTRLFSALSNEEIRQIVYILVHREKTTIALPDLTRAVSAAVNEERAQVRKRMVHRHLPRLGFLGIIDYDLMNEPRVWLSKNTDIIDKKLLYDIVESIERYERG